LTADAIGRGCADATRFYFAKDLRVELIAPHLIGTPGADGEFDLMSVNDVRSNDRGLRLDQRRENLTYAAFNFVNPKRIRFRSACR